MLFSSRRSDDADVIRARLRALLAEGAAPRGWLPDDEHDEHDERVRGPQHWQDDEDDDTWETGDVHRDRAAPAADPHADPDAGDGAGEGAATAYPGGGSGRHRASGPSTRVDPGPHGARTLWAVAVAAALVVAGWSWISRPAVSPAPASDGATGVGSDVPAGASAGAPVDDASAVPAASTGVPTGTAGAEPQQIVVAVVGQVVSPGLVTLPVGSRVADALTAAGGLLPEADPASINAAAVLADGQQIAVGVPGAGGSAAAAPGSGGGGLLDLNTATVTDLDALPGIGPVLAQRIVDHRTQHGRFTSVEQLDDVSGIGPSLYAEIEPLVTA